MCLISVLKLVLELSGDVRQYIGTLPEVCFNNGEDISLILADVVLQTCNFMNSTLFRIQRTEMWCPY